MGRMGTRMIGIGTRSKYMYENPYEYALSWDAWWDAVEDYYSPYVGTRYMVGYVTRKYVSPSEYKKEQRQKWFEWSQKRRRELTMEGKL